MDYLLTIEPSLAEEAYRQVTDLLNLEVDLLFFDTTSTYFETGEEDGPVPRDEDGQRVAEDSDEAVKETGFRARGKSKDSRDDLPQVVVGMAVARDGIPVRVWSWPGSTTDTDLIRQVRDETSGMDPLAGHLGRRPRLHLPGENRRALMRGGGGYIVGEKLRSGSAEVRAALSRQGRYAAVRDNMQVKEVNIGTDDRFVLCCNPAQAERDAIVRAKLDRAARRSDHRYGQADQDRGRPDRGHAVGQARSQAVPAPGARRAAARGQAEVQDRDEPGRQVPAALLRPAPVRRGHRPGLQAAPGSRARLARHETGPRPAGPSTTGARTASAPTSCCAGSPCC